MRNSSFWSNFTYYLIKYHKLRELISKFGCGARTRLHSDLANGGRRANQALNFGKNLIISFTMLRLAEKYEELAQKWAKPAPPPLPPAI